ncbi:DNA repair protein RecN [Conexibacter sp. SYSU D00693]|uniref:DNA repair protein RecN n=1 Tax=Conexibacter sp. SYSU D00693 TaxID=2812560 RepID=UPI00196A31D4|nr:DNA repair protein RecN [Conexibacter sp. SYSU D00693]
MLHELRVENLLLIERAELRLAPGLNVLTGETGAGKTVLAHALDLLLGGKAKTGVVRPGAAEAYVEGVFELTEALRELLGDRVAPDAEELVLARRVSAEGRTRAYLNGRSAPVADLREAAEGLLSFYGQHEHRRLTLASSQLELLDGFAGPAQAARRAACAAAHATARRLEGSLDELRERAGARERELDLLEFELREIEDAGLTEGEEAELQARRSRLRHVEALRAAALGAAEAIGAEDGGAVVALAGGGALLDGVDGVDPALDALAVRWRALAIEADDLAGELRRLGEDLVDGEPGELDRVEDRLGLYDRLCRKHGGSVAAVLAHADACRLRRDELDRAEVALEEATAALDAARAEHARVAAELHEARAAAAGPLAEAVRERLAELAMDGASFEIALGAREPGPTGTDAVEFLIAPNPGVPPAPLRETASGGELSRVMLALTATAAQSAAAAAAKGGTGAKGAAKAGTATGTPVTTAGGATLVFDEIDAGIGGHTARAVGEQLRALGEGRQVLAITHLPQVASLAARHFSIEKDTSVEPARTTVRTLASKEVVGELVRMLGADETDMAARRHAKDLLRAA